MVCSLNSRLPAWIQFNVMRERSSFKPPVVRANGRAILPWQTEKDNSYLFRTPQRLNCFGVLPSQGSDFSVVDRYSILFYNPGAVTISNKFSSGMEGLPCGSSVNSSMCDSNTVVVPELTKSQKSLTKSQKLNWSQRERVGNKDHSWRNLLSFEEENMEKSQGEKMLPDLPSLVWNGSPSTLFCN
ncbi:hypothetical protein C5167_013193 [Papaver somniferum]|uniref:Uncharacterized protein n=1 Tax=Papaver somniferum TaxID=3469 RepID=A0A4Y7IZM9_PAPSO|nr:hypothetical protein C5167_013193 [Papaver somniferum]